MAQLAERGLIIKTPDGEFTTPVKTVSAEGIDGSYDVVLVTCKAYNSMAQSTTLLPLWRRTVRYYR